MEARGKGGKGGRRWTAEISNQQNKDRSRSRNRSRRGDRFITDENRYKSEVGVERGNARMNTLGTGVRQSNRVEVETQKLAELCDGINEQNRFHGQMMKHDLHVLKIKTFVEKVNLSVVFENVKL